MKKNNDLFMHLLSFILTLSFSQDNLQASNDTDPLGQTDSKKRSALSAFGEDSNTFETQKRLNKKPRFNINISEGSTDAQTIKENNPLIEFSFFEYILPELLWHITSLLPHKDIMVFALCDHHCNDLARKHLMERDIRDLKNKEWQNGPQNHTFRNYLFNQIMWKIGKDLLTKKSSNNQQDTHNEPLTQESAYFEGHFGDLTVSKSILEGYRNPKNFFESENYKAMEKHAAEHPTSGEADFTSLIHYLATGTYKVSSKRSKIMGLTERFYHVLRAHQYIISPTFSCYGIIDRGEFLMAYDLEPTTKETFKILANAHFDIYNDTTPPSYLPPSNQITSLQRATELYDLAIDQWGDPFDLSLYKGSAIGHFLLGETKLGNTNPQQKLSSFVRFTERLEQILNAEDKKNHQGWFILSGIAYSYIFEYTNDPNQKAHAHKRLVQNFMPEAEL